MEIKLPTYRKLPGVREPVIRPEFRDKAEEHFEKKEYLQSIAAVIRYMHPGLLDDAGVEDTIHITHRQGSAVIEIKAENGVFQVYAPFLRIGEKTNKVALLRKIAEINFNRLSLTRITLRDDVLFFHFSSPFDLCLPEKVYEAIREISVNADRYDDIFVNRFAAELYQPVQRTEPAEKLKEEIWDYIELIFREYKEMIELFKKERMESFYWDALADSILKISNISYVHGQLQTDLYDAFYNLIDTSVEYKSRIDSAMRFMDKLMARSKEDIMKNIYETDYLLAMQMRCTPERRKDFLMKYKNNLESYKKKDDKLNVSFLLEYVFLKLMFDYNLDPEVKDKVENTLVEVSGMDAEKSMDQLYRTYNDLLSPDGGNGGEKKKGFFEKLFG